MNAYIGLCFLSSLMFFYSGREACQRFARTFPLQSVSLCPGDTVNYTCTINDTSQSASVVTTWAGSVFKQCSPSQILLAQRGLGGATDPTSSGACGNLSAMTTDITGSCYTSVLTIFSPRYVNGSTVLCGGAVAVGNDTLNVLMACPPSPPTITPVSCTSSSLTINWTKPSECGSPISQYTLTTNPPSLNCNPSCTQSPDLTQATLTVQPNRSTTVSLRADNCGGTQAGQTSSASYIMQAIGSVIDFYGMPVFSVQSRYAVAIRFSWSPLPLQLHPGEMSCGFNQNYALNIVEASNVTHTITIRCSPPTCGYEYPVGEGVTAPRFNCSIKDYTGEIPISLSNDIMAVSVTGTVVNCTFLSGLVGTSGCVVSFGTSPDNLPYTLTSSQSGGSGQSISIPLVINGAPLPPATTYHYEVHLGSQDGAQHGLVVRGSFTTADQPTSATATLTTSVRSETQTAIAIGVGVGGGVLSLLVVVVVIAIIAASKPCRHQHKTSTEGKQPAYEDTAVPGHTGKRPAYEDTAVPGHTGKRPAYEDTVLPGHPSSQVDLDVRGDVRNTDNAPSPQSGVAKIAETGLVYATVSVSSQPREKHTYRPTPVDSNGTAVIYSTVAASDL